MPRTRPPYREEFRRETIRLARLGDKPQCKLARDLGISDVTLRHWLKEDARTLVIAVTSLGEPLEGWCSERVDGRRLSLKTLTRIPAAWERSHLKA